MQLKKMCPTFHEHKSAIPGFLYVFVIFPIVNVSASQQANWVHSSVHGTLTPPWPFAWPTAGSAGTIPSATSSTWAKVAVEKEGGFVIGDLVIFDLQLTHIGLVIILHVITLSGCVGLEFWGAWWRLRVEEPFFRPWRRRPRAPTAETAPR